MTGHQDWRWIGVWLVLCALGGYCMFRTELMLFDPWLVGVVFFAATAARAYPWGR